MYARAGLNVLIAIDRILGKRAKYGLNGSMLAITANKARLGRARTTPLSTAAKARLEQGTMAVAVRYGPVPGDTGCV